MSSAFPSRQRLPPGLPDSSLNSREELYGKEALLVARCEDNAVCRKLELVACVQGLLEVDVNEDVGGVPHAWMEISDLPLTL